MNPDCNILNPLQRDGLSQDERFIRALHPSYVQVDEKDISELLLYARDYARLVQYYSVENNKSGDWRKFIESDITTLVAMIVKFDAKSYKDQYDAVATADFLPRFTTTVSLAEEVYYWYAGAISELKLYASLERVINSILNPELENIIAFAKRLEEVDAFLTILDNIDLDFSGISINSVQADSTLFPSNDISDAKDINDAERKLKRTFQTIYETVLSILFQAPDFLEETLEDYHKHHPHIALFLAFLKLFKIAQDHLNTLTKRHLDFYYQEVLHLELKPEQADEVHIVFELAKNFNAELVEEDTLLKAGKDEGGTNVFFGLDNDIVVNKTKLYEQGLKTVFLDKKYDTSTTDGLISRSTPYTIQNIYAAPKANSLDGIEEELEANEKWLTFGGESMPYAEVGFALSSPIFLLKEGERIINVNFTFEKITPSTGIENIDFTDTDILRYIRNELKDNIKLAYSGEEDWVETLIDEVNVFRCPPSGTMLNDQVFIFFKIILSSEKEAFLGFQNEVLKPGLSTSQPTLRFIFDNEGLSKSSLETVSGDINLTIAQVKENASPYVDGTAYVIGDVVTYENEWYYAIANSQDSKPVSGSTRWSLIEKSYPYHYFLPLELRLVNLNVEVNGLQDLILENDVGTINPAKPFMPFGPLPKVGSKFYIGSNEIFHKPISNITLDFEWADLPTESFRDHYNEYRDDPSDTTVGSYAIEDNNHFNADIELLYNKQWLNTSPLSTGAMQLFSTSGDIITDTPNAGRQQIISFSGFAEASEILNFESLDNNLQRGFLRLNLQQDFLHKSYPKWIAKAAIINAEDRIPNEPYTPTIGSFKLNYTASDTLTFDETIYEDKIEKFFHITPFGWQAFYPNGTKLPKDEAVYSEKLIPEFLVADKEDLNAVRDTDAEGTLYIGMTDLEPEQNVSFLFQMAEGSADPDIPKQSITWYYLSDNNWVEFDRTQILSDTTNDLLTSGIITLTMPKAMTKDNTILDQEAHWIKVCTARQVDGISQAIAIMPQAVKASFRKEPENDLNRLSTPLPSETIAKLKERKAIVKSVLQPFSSFNGQLQEQNATPEGVSGEDRYNKDYNEFYIRVSERLKHKNRAVTIDDYERLVLQQFPDVYKAKCINHTRIASIKEDGTIIHASEHAPGHVKLIVLPNLRNRNAVNPLQPKVSSNQLDEIFEYLNPLKCDFVTLEVQNPIFEEVSVDFNVRLLPGFDKGFYTKKLKEDIVRFLTPWLYDDGADLALGGKIHRSVILNFVEETEYVDYVTDFKLNHFVPGQSPRMDVEEAITTTSSSVIVSKEANEHEINPDILEAC